MKYVVIRTSDWYGKPCDEAFEGTVTNVDIRSVDDPSKLNHISREEWYSKGSNHRLINGNIARDMGLRTVWMIEINTLEELNDFYSKYGTLVIGKSCIDYYSLEIEIYDDYRE